MIHTPEPKVKVEAKVKAEAKTPVKQEKQDKQERPMSKLHVWARHASAGQASPQAPPQTAQKQPQAPFTTLSLATYNFAERCAEIMWAGENLKSTRMYPLKEKTESVAAEFATKDGSTITARVTGVWAGLVFADKEPTAKTIRSSLVRRYKKLKTAKKVLL